MLRELGRKQLDSTRQPFRFLLSSSTTISTMPQPLSQQPTNIPQDPSMPNQSPKQRRGTANQDANPKIPSPSKRPTTSPTSTTAQQRQPSATQSSMKKITRRSSKPIINWFQRKLAGTVRARRASDPNASRADRLPGTRSPTSKDSHRRSSGPPQPPVSQPVRQRSNRASRTQPRVPSTIASTKRNTVISLNDDDLNSAVDAHTLDSYDGPRTSSVLESTWSPRSIEEADEDASVRPIYPSAPPSPSPSRSSSSYLSDPRTFASIAASTKPTTILSVDLTGGMAHIAQAPPTPTVPNYRITHHVRTHSSGPSIGGSITFSALPITTPPSHPSSTSQGHVSNPSRSLSVPLQAPQHTTHHPRNNPHPSSPPSDDASVLTLASSAFGLPGARIGAGTLALSGGASIADDSISHFSNMPGLGDSASHFVLNDADGDGDDAGLLLSEGERFGYGDVDASVRALRPRSSRRGSWESELSGWSARLAGVSMGPGTPSAFRDRSFWTNGSYRTGTRSVDIENAGDQESGSDESDGEEEDRVRRSGLELSTLGSVASERSGSITESAPAPMDDVSTSASPTIASSMESGALRTPPAGSPQLGSSTPREKSQDTPKGTPIPLEEQPPMPSTPANESSLVHNSLHLEVPQDDRAETYSLATTDNQTDLFVSAPSTPMDC